MKLIALQTKTKKNFKKNLDKLLELIEKCEDGSFILAPELCLTGFSYDRMDEASEFAIKAKKKIKKLSQNKTIALTFIEKEDIEYYNTLYIFHKGKVIHSQSKHRLFPLGDEPAHFAKGKLENMKIIEIDGMWGAKRKTHFETMTKALAIANQCYVLTANSADDNMAKGSGVISPWGDETRDDSKEVISSQLDLNEISKIRKYIDIGLKNK
jgi:predicted amidohydrolase